MASKLAKRGVGRPSKCTDATIAKLAEGIKLGLTIGLACSYANVHPNTWHMWMARSVPGHEGYHHRYEKFRVAMTEAEAKGAAMMMARVTAAARTDWKAAAWVLERRHKYTKSPDIAVQVNGPTVTIANALADRQAQRDVIDAEDVEVTPTLLLERRVDRLRRQLEAAEGARNHQAIAALGRQYDEAEERLLDLRMTGEGSPEQMPEERFQVELRAAAEEMPEAHLALVAQVWLERHGLVAVSRPRSEGPTAIKARMEG